MSKTRWRLHQTLCLSVLSILMHLLFFYLFLLFLLPRRFVTLLKVGWISVFSVSHQLNRKLSELLQFFSTLLKSKYCRSKLTYNSIFLVLVTYPFQFSKRGHLHSTNSSELKVIGLLKIVVRFRVEKKRGFKSGVVHFSAHFSPLKKSKKQQEKVFEQDQT